MFLENAALVESEYVGRTRVIVTRTNVFRKEQVRFVHFVLPFAGKPENRVIVERDPGCLEISNDFRFFDEGDFVALVDHVAYPVRRAFQPDAHVPRS